MGKILSLLSKPIRDYNIESRAHKIISTNKPTPAPKHKSDALHYERIMKESPKYFSEMSKKDETLDRRLKDVFVTSHDPPPIIYRNIQNPDRLMPLSKEAVEDYEFGVKEPVKVPLGKVTLRHIVKFLTDYQLDPKPNSATKIAEEYCLPEKTVGECNLALYFDGKFDNSMCNVLKYFKIYDVYITQTENQNVQLIGPYIRKKKVKALGSGKEKEDT